MSIPIIILNFNRLSTLEKLVDQLLVLGYSNLYVLDMGSTYEPLLDYYNTCKDFSIIFHENKGHKALWNDGILKEYFGTYDWICVTDSDIELSVNTPKGFIEDMIYTAKDFRSDKCGLALEYKDISNQYLKDIVEPIEKRYWMNRLPHPTQEVFVAPVDTTFCVVRPLLPFSYNAIRLAGIYTAIHTDWYLNFNKLTEEQLYYMNNCDPVVATTAGHYFKWLKENE